MKYCTHPHLVGLDHELPSDPSVAYAGTLPVIGCNHLVCSKCGVVVRHADGRATTSNYPPGEALARELYEMSDARSHPRLDSTPLHARSRAYFCRCDWSDATLGGIRSLGDIDAMWWCGGHPWDPTAVANPPPVAPRLSSPPIVARAATPPTPPTPPTASIVPRAPTSTEAPAVAKIKLSYAPGVNPEFATASQLRDCLLASYPAADYFGGPLVGLDKPDDVAPAWGWVADLLRMRSDWLPALGIALEHATRDGGDLARRALADLCAGFTESIALLPWTSKIAASYPDVVASSAPETGWGSDDRRLASIVRDQERALATSNEPDVVLDGYGKRNADIHATLTNEDELRAVLAESARAGRFLGTRGPWSWLRAELFATRGEWMWPGLVRALEASDDDVYVINAALDWFSEQRDLWRFHSVLSGWRARPAAWFVTPVVNKPKGWQRKMRVTAWREPKALGDVVIQALWRAERQRATPAIIDL